MILTVYLKISMNEYIYIQTKHYKKGNRNNKLMNLDTGTNNGTQMHTLSEPGSVARQSYQVKGVDRVASEGSSSGGSNYLLMNNVYPARSSSQSFHTINPSLYNNTPSPVINLPQPTPTHPHLHISSNTIKQHIQLPLTYTPPERPITITTTPGNINIKKLTSYRYQDPIIQQQEHNYKFQFIQLKTAYQQLKQSHEELMRQYEVLRQRIVVVRNNQEVLVGRNDELMRGNSALQTKVYQLQEELRVVKMSQEASNNTNAARYRPSVMVNNEQQLQPSSLSLSPRIDIRPQTPINTFLSSPRKTPSPNISPALNQPYHLPLLQLQHQNRQLLYRVHQYQSSIVYKNSQLQKLMQQLKDKNIQINSLRRQLQTYIKRQSLYQQNQSLMQKKSQQLTTLTRRLQLNQKQHHRLRQQCANLQDDLKKKKYMIDEMNNELSVMKQLQQKNRQLLKENEQCKRIISSLEKINNQQQITVEIHKQLLQNISPPYNRTHDTSNNNNNNRTLPTDLLYQHLPNQDFSKVLTTYVGDETTITPEHNDYSKNNLTMNNHNVINGGVRQGDMLGYRLGDRILENGQGKKQLYAANISNGHYHTHNYAVPESNKHSNSLLSQLSQGISKDLKQQPLNSSSTNSKLNIDDQAYFDFGKQAGDPLANQKPSLSSNTSGDNIKPHHYHQNNRKPQPQQQQQERMVIDTLSSQQQNEYYQSSNILSFPQLPFTIKQQDQQNRPNTVTFAGNIIHTPENDYSTDKVKSKKHARIFPPQTSPTTQNNSLQPLQHRILQLSQENKSLRQYLVKKSSS